MKPIALSLIALLVAGCAQQSYLMLLDSPDGRPGAVTLRQAGGEATLEQPGSALALGGERPEPITISPEQFQRDFAATRAAQPAMPKRFVLYFETGGIRLTPESEAQRGEILASVRQYPAAEIAVVGHTDTAGDAAANEKLALERARFVADWLRTAQPQVVELTVSSHGERNLLVPTADGVAEPRNRRVEVTVR